MGKNQSSSVEELSNCIMNNPALVAQLSALGFQSSNPGGMTFREAMICSQIASAVRGDRRAFEDVMIHTGQGSVMPLELFVTSNADAMFIE